MGTGRVPRPRYMHSWRRYHLAPCSCASIIRADAASNRSRTLQFQREDQLQPIGEHDLENAAAERQVVKTSNACFGNGMEEVHPFIHAQVGGADLRAEPEIAEHVEHGEEQVIKSAARQMILDDYAAASHAANLLQECAGFDSVVKHVREKRDVERAVP